MTATKVILLSGISASGKTDFAHWLRDQGWIIVESDPFYRRAAPKTKLEQAGVPCLFGNGDSQQLLAQIAASTSPILVEWGFPVALLRTVILLLQLGMEGWWFDGDLDACHTAWRQVTNQPRTNVSGSYRCPASKPRGHRSPLCSDTESCES